MPAPTRAQISILHIAFVAPLLVYISLNGVEPNTSFAVFLALLALAVALYHGTNI